MMEWNVAPTVEVNGVKFGTDRNVVRTKFGEPIEEFKKSKFSKNTTDDYGTFHAFYDADNRLEAVEIFEGNVVADGKTIFPCKCEEISAFDESFQKEDDGYTSMKLSIGIYAPYGEAESILIGCEGYYV